MKKQNISQKALIKAAIKYGYIRTLEWCEPTISMNESRGEYLDRLYKEFSKLDIKEKKYLSK